MDTNRVRVGPIIYAAIALHRINDGWHSFQLGLPGPSKYGQFRTGVGTGHRVHHEKFNATAQASHVEIDQGSLDSGDQCL